MQLDYFLSVFPTLSGDWQENFFMTYDEFLTDSVGFEALRRPNNP